MTQDDVGANEAYSIEDDGAVLRLPPMIARAALAEDKDGEHAFAESTAVSFTPHTIGRWDSPAPGIRRWRLAVERDGALSINLGFTRYLMPRGGTLELHDAQGKTIAKFGDEHVKAHRELWTPIVPGIRATIEVTVPERAEKDLVLELSNVGAAFRDFVEPRAGACNVDVACADGDAWRNEIRSVGVISLGGSTMCTGTLVSDAAGDRRPFFLTARHCRVTAANAASLVVYWNYQSSTCGGERDGRLDQFQTGAIFRAARDTSDFTLVELDDDPAPEHGVYWSGWDARDIVPTSAVAIHHPRTDEKSISFENDPLTVTGYLGNSSPGDGSHLRVADWDIGTTEPGSSGSGLWNPEHRLVGQLHGGYAACGNDRADWYGWLAKSWDGAAPEQRLRDWLDPTGATQLFVDGTAPCDPPKVDLAIPETAAVGAEMSVSASVEGGQPPYTFAWDLNADGAPDCSGADCAYTFDRDFDGSASLVVTDATGCRATRRQRLVVSAPAQEPTPTPTR